MVYREHRRAERVKVLARDDREARAAEHLHAEDGEDEHVCCRIRAIQGHSTHVASESLGRKILRPKEHDFPSILGHATNYCSLESILDIGLKPGGLKKSGTKITSSRSAPRRTQRTNLGLEAKRLCPA